MSSIVVVSVPATPERPPQRHTRHLSTLVSRRDLIQPLVRSIGTPAIPFAIVRGVSNNRYKRLDLTSARELPGYAPEDDAFRLFDVPLPE